jgi:hypothetical protein
MKKHTTSVIGGENMKKDRMWGIIIGALFLIAMGSSMVGDGMISSKVSDPNYLVILAENRNPVIAGALLWLLDGLAVIGIAFFMYPYLKKTHGPMALGYVGVRIAELGLILAYLSAPVMMVRLSQNFIDAGQPSGTHYQLLGSILNGIQYWTLQLIYIFNGVAGLVLCVLLYRSRIVARFISAIGIIGYGVLLPASLLDLFGLLNLDQLPGMLIFIPGTIFEIFLFPIWLFAKGFNLEAGNDQ